MKYILILVIAILLNSCVYNKKELPEPISPPQKGVTITYTKHGKGVFDTYCINCHSSTGTGQLPFLTTYQEVKLQADNGRIQARAIDNSPSAMPPGNPLPQDIKDTLQFWINQGALQ
jgi:mono/diheme cytochrome c family protein